MTRTLHGLYFGKANGPQEEECQLQGLENSSGQRQEQDHVVQDARGTSSSTTDGGNPQVKAASGPSSSTPNTSAGSRPLYYVHNVLKGGTSGSSQVDAQGRLPTPEIMAHDVPHICRHVDQMVCNLCQAGPPLVWFSLLAWREARRQSQSQSSGSN